MECCSLRRNPLHVQQWVSDGGFHCSFLASCAVWAIRIQWRATIRACLIEWGQPSGLLGRAMQLTNALTHHFSDIFHKCSHLMVIVWGKREKCASVFPVLYSIASYTRHATFTVFSLCIALLLVKMLDVLSILIYETCASITLWSSQFTLEVQAPWQFGCWTVGRVARTETDFIV